MKILNLAINYLFYTTVLIPSSLLLVANDRNTNLLVVEAVTSSDDEYYIPIQSRDECWYFNLVRKAKLFGYSNDPGCIYTPPNGPNNPSPHVRTKLSRLKKIDGNKYVYKRISDKDSDGNKIKVGWKGTFTVVTDPQYTSPTVISKNINSSSEVFEIELGVSPMPSMEPSVTTPIETVDKFDAGHSHTCAQNIDGRLQCWGLNDFGQLGDGTRTDKSIPTFVEGLAAGDVDEVQLGQYNTCALIYDGTLMCWGRNYYGQIGDGTTTDRLIPTLVQNLGNVVAYSVGTLHVCAKVSDGDLKCWGRNYHGQIGDGAGGWGVVRLTPTTVQNLAGGDVLEFASGYHNCALIVDRTLRCWGYNFWGSLGDGTRTHRDTPTLVQNLAGDVAAVAVGMGSHTCAILTDGTLQCWGLNNHGQLGDGLPFHSHDSRPTPAFVQNLAGDVAKVTIGSWFTCALLTDGRLQCFGNNAVGQLGDGTNDDRPTPTFTQDLGGEVVAVATGSTHTCSKLSNGRLICWGGNSNGQVGIPPKRKVLKPHVISLLAN